jgi:chromosome segregation ATPase
MGGRCLPCEQACEAVVAMGSLLEELARRETEARRRIEEIREQIAGLESRLEAEEDRLSRLMITRETVEEPGRGGAAGGGATDRGR